MKVVIFSDVQQAASRAIENTRKVSVSLRRSDMPDYLELDRQLLNFQR